jgi:hypothetical protein
MSSEIPKDSHIIEAEGHKYLAHKGCVYDEKNAKFSNNLFTICEGGMPEAIKIFRIICDLNDGLNEKTNFVNGRYKELCVSVPCEGQIYLTNDLDLDGIPVIFKSLQKLLHYLGKNYPKCIKQ